MTTSTLQLDPQAEQFQTLMRELFQCDRADLDFGIYRIMNHKREVIDKYIGEDLPALISQELFSGELGHQAENAAKLEEAAQRIRDVLGAQAFDADGQLDPALHSYPVCQEYLSARAAVVDGFSDEALKASVYNHLYNFFSRYYQDGDFIPKRRFSRNQRYAIPYGGEEVYLHWVNNDQYYVKSAEYFQNYDWTAPNGILVQFRLQAADVEQDNVKGNGRFFFPVVEETEWDSESRVVKLPIVYRLPTVQEAAIHGSSQQQKKIIRAAVNEVQSRLTHAPEALAGLGNTFRDDSSGKPISCLQHHLTQYTRRNNSDFFIHKNLAAFLSRELDFYLKNEILNLDVLLAGGEQATPSWFQLLRLMKFVGSQLIDFLAQIEDFQKMLWEKTKFIKETQYCVALGAVDSSFYKEICENEAQRKEWQGIFGDDDLDINPEFLDAYPTLLLDTRHFSNDFVCRLLAIFEDLDAMTDGLLIHGDNWQAMRLLAERYKGQVQCIYLDPPYNTGNDEFLYKDSFQHSTWLSMMNNLMPSWSNMLTPAGSLISHIDEHEFGRLDELFRVHFGEQQIVGPIIWDKRNPKGDATAIASQHEYICWAVKDFDALKSTGEGLTRGKENAQLMLRKAEELISVQGRINEGARTAFKSWVTSQDFSGGLSAYSNIDDNGNVFRPVSMAWPNQQRAPEHYFLPLIHPVTRDPCPVPGRGWRNPPETMQRLLNDDLILFGPDESTQPTRKYLLKDNLSENVPSLYYFGGSDVPLQQNLGYSFPNPKPVRLAEYLISIAAPRDGSVVMDCFAGSGTTGHAVINLNREDGARRKFLLVEMGEYFDTVLLPRIKKVVLTPEWIRSKPQRKVASDEAQLSPRIIKYIRIESYEDALDCIEFSEQVGRMNLAEEIDDYLIKYMLKWESSRSQTLFNASSLNRPFDYKLYSHSDGSSEEKSVDIAETFNYLIGLHVQSRTTYDDIGRRYLVYRGTMKGTTPSDVTVIWRQTEGWDVSDFKRERDFVVANILIEQPDLVYVNGTSCIPGAQSVEPVFQGRMFSGVRI